MSLHAMSRLRRFAAWSYGCYAWLVFALVLLSFGSLIILLRSPRHGRPVARAGMRLLFRLAGMPIAVHGGERLPRTPHILLVNHTSFLDGLALTALLPARPGYAFVVRQQYASQRLLCPLLRGLGTVVLHRDHRHTVTNTATNVDLLKVALRRGKNLIVFPEGSVVPETGLQPFHSGAFIVAIAENVPIVVAGLRGTRKALRLGTWLPRRTAIALEVGPVLQPGAAGADQEQKLRKAAHQAMLPLTGEGA